MGGSTAINANFYVWGSKHDYDLWEKMGATGWSFKDVVNHFISLENSCLINGSKTTRGQKGEVKLSFPYQTPIAKFHFDAGKELGELINVVKS